MIHEAYMPVYRCPDFHCAGGRGFTRGSTRGPRGPKKDDCTYLYVLQWSDFRQLPQILKAV